MEFEKTDSERPDSGHRRGLLQGVLLIGAILFLCGLTRPPKNDFAINRGSRILLADFADTTGDPALGSGLKQLLRITLDQSPHFLLFPESKTRNALKRMRRNPGEGITRDVAALICLQEGIPAFIVPSLSRLEDAFLISVHLVRVRNGKLSEIPVDTVRAKSEIELICSIDELGGKARKMLGEADASLETTGRVLAPSARENPEALTLFIRALALGAKENYEAETAILEQAVRLNPRFALAQLRLAERYDRLGQKEAAFDFAAQANQAPETLPLKEKYRAGGIHCRLKQEYDKAREHLLALVSAYPDDCDAWLQLGEIAVLQRDFGRASEHFEKAIRLDDSRVEAYLGLSMACLLDRKTDSARKAWGRASELTPTNPEVISMGGFIDLIDNNLGSALRAFRQVGENSSAQIRSLGLFLLAQAQVYGGRFQAAHATLADGVEWDKSRGDRASEAGKHLARAQVYLLQGNPAGALEECRQTTLISRGVNDIARLGSIYAQLGRITEARDLLGRINKLQGLPRNRYQAAILEGEIDLARGDLQAAISRLGGAGNMLPGGRPALEPLARALAQAGRLGEAGKEYRTICDRKAEMLFPPAGNWFTGTWVNVLFDTGLCLADQGQFSEALQYFRNYLWVLDGADPEFPRIRQAKEQLRKRSSKTGMP